MTEHAIIMRAVNKYYGAFHALTDIDLRPLGVGEVDADPHDQPA